MKKKNLISEVLKTMTGFMALIGIVLCTGIDSKAAGAKVDNNNDTISTAADIILDTTYAGNCDSWDDEDWYHFVIPATAKESYFNIVLGPEDDNSITVEGGWECYVYMKGEAESRYKMDHIKNKTTSANLPFGPGEYYLKIKPYNIYSHSTENYNFSVKFTNDAHWETERNDDWASANRIHVNETYHGNLFQRLDEDCYTFVISEPGEVVITFGANASEDITKMSTAGWKLSLYKENEASPCAQLSSVIAVTSTEKCNLGAGTYQIRISGGGFGPYNPGSETYDFSVGYKAAQNDKDGTASIKESKVDVASIKSAAKKQVYLKWKKNKYADGYKVYRSIKKKTGYKCIATLKKRSKVSYTDKKVKSKKVYYYKVRAYRKIGKKTIYSGYSPVKRVKVK